MQTPRTQRPDARLPSGRFAALVAAIVFAFACSRGGSQAGAKGRDAAPEAAPDAEIDGFPGATCQAIRLCVAGVVTAADEQKCLAMGTAEARAAYQVVASCLTSPPAMCASAFDLTCACPEECYADGYCTAEAAACLGDATTDLFCNGPCAP